MQKIIFLVDMDAFFISCESARNPELIEKPAAVAGDPKKRSGIILTANYAARKYGIKTTMVLNKALRLCPNLIILPSDMEFYRQKSKQVLEIFSHYTPIIEQNSIDEAWLDMTGSEALFGDPLKSTKLISDQIKNELGLSSSIGISENKFLSKMASDMKKPGGITELWQKNIKEKLWPLSIKSMYGVGRQTSAKLESIGIKTIGELANSDKNRLVKKFGKVGTQIYLLANGIDTSHVKPHSHNEMKSIGKSITLPEDITNIEAANLILMRLSDEISMSARKHGKKGHIVQIVIKYYNFKVITRQKTVPQTCLAREIYSAGAELLKNNWDKQIPIRLLGISLSGFENEGTVHQISIFEMSDAQNAEDNSIKTYKLESTVDKIRSKYGDSIINRAIFLDNNPIRK